MWFMCEFGNYLQTSHAICEVIGNPDEIEARLEDVKEYIVTHFVYPEAYQQTEGWVGSNGFCDDGEMTAEGEHEEIEQSLDYSAEVYNAKKHDGHLCGNQREWEPNWTVNIEDVK